MSQSPARGSRRPGLRLGIIILVIILLLILLILLFFFPRPSATVTLTPESHNLSNSTTESAETHNLSSTEQGSQTGNSTGQPNPGTHATGTLTFQNSTFVWVTIPAGTSISNNNGQQVVTDSSVNVPPDPPAMPGVAVVSAHAANVGTAGNIPAMSFNKTPCCSSISSGITVTNEPAFSGGTDSQTTTTVQQSDVDGVAKTLEASLTSKAQGDIQKQLTSGEQLVTSAPQCSVTNVTSNPNVGESATSFTVTASLACSDAAYNAQTARDQAENELKQTAAQQFPGFVLDGTITTTIDKVTPGQNGNVDVLVTAKGTWKYQLTASQKSSIAKHIARESKDAAITWLKQQTGVSNATISIRGPIIDLTGDNTLPDDPSAITING